MARRWLTWISCGATIVCVAGSYRGVFGAQQPSTSPQAFVNQYCIACHNDRAKVAGLSLSAVDVDNVEAHLEVWEKVARKLNARVMPPPGLPRPDDAVYEAFVTHLETSIDRLAAEKPNPGRTDTFHRLNRTEYRNAVRDLLAFDITDVESLLPKDEESFGFDNVNVASLSPSLMERYVAAAQEISHLAIGNLSRLPGPTNVVMPADLTQEGELEGSPLGTRGGTIFRHTFPADGEYEIEIRLSRDRDEHVEGLNDAHEMELRVDGIQVKMFEILPDDVGQGVFAVRVPLKAGPREVAVTFLKRPSALLETERQPYIARYNIYRHPRIQPAVYRVSVAGPFKPTGPGDTPSRQRIFTCQPSRASETPACARQILSAMARQAYRRPVADKDVRALMTFFENGRENGGFEAGIETALSAILVSPEFLFRVEREPKGAKPGASYRVSDLELASRLSFFLWSSIPDAELLNAAVDGRLRQPDVLERQVRRMLSDARSDALVNNFAGQWLQLRNLADVSPFPRAFPEFDDNLRQAFRRETELFFESIIREDRSLMTLIDADYTFLNERLAKHYGIPNVYGGRFRRVALGPEANRGGLLGQGSLLTVTSYPTRTAPTLRGKWILENILGTPPPAPPPNIPKLKENDGSGKPMTMRQLMAQHGSNPSCAGCHRMMDPIGFALENYDAVGHWRNHQDDAPIDPSGSLPDGSTFQGAAGLKKALVNRPGPFLVTTTRKLLTYALGRGVEYYDAPAIRKIVHDARDEDYRFSSVVMGIVRSTPFQMRRAQ